MIMRRAITIPGVVIIFITLYGLSPFLYPLSFVMSIFKPFRSLPRFLTFSLGVVLFELLGDIGLLFATRHRGNHDRFMLANRRVQFWWGQKLLNLGVRVFDLSLSITGEEAIQGKCALVVSRHTSMGDTLLPLVCFGVKRDENLRYILKRELLIFPSLDVGGNRLPNLFVDRTGTDTEKQLNAIRKLTAQASSNESVLVYPEGTRYTVEKKAKLARSHPNLKEQLERWPNLLPPRLGGLGAMLEVNPGKDVVFLCHTGFEGSASIRDLFNGGWCHQQVRIHFWRIAYEDIPADHQQFIFEQWDQMQATVEKLMALD